MSGRPMGRPPKPAGLRILEGNPGKRRIPDEPDAPPIGEVGEPPIALRAAERRIYDRIAASIPWLKTSDAATVALLAEAIAYRNTLRVRLGREGRFHLNDETGRSAVHALLAELRGARNEIRDYLIALGATPTDRARVAGDSSGKGDELTAWQKRRGTG